MKHIPQKLVKDFVRGWIDGDGCFYHNAKNSCSQFIISGPYNQDWSFFQKILEELEISRYKHVQKTQTQNGKENKCSIIRICNRNDIKKLHDFLYDDPKNFLPRKYEKSLSIINSIKS